MTAPREQRSAWREEEAARDFAAAVAHERAGRRDRAATLYKKVLQKVPDHVDALHRLGIIAHDRGRNERAIQLIGQALALDPTYAAAHVNLGNALRASGRQDEAAESYARALVLKPDNPFAHANLAAILNDQEQFEAALASADRALALAPELVAAQVNRADALAGLGRLAEAEEALRRALALAPDLAPMWARLGSTLRAAGEMTEAVTCFEHALALQPDMADAELALALMHQPPTGGALEKLARLASNESTVVSERVVAGFALGTFLDNAGRYDDAFPHFTAANALRHNQLVQAGRAFDAAAFAADVAGVIGRSPSSLFSAARGFGNPSDFPVFIVGMPRSGTSLVEQIAASHSRVFGAGERREIAKIYDEVIGQNRGKPTAAWDMDAARARADAHIARLQKLGQGAARVIDTMPDNILHLGIIAVLFPGARVIFCRRDARDTCLSCYFQHFVEGHEFSFALADCGRRWRETERLAEHWRRVLPLSMLTIDYEKLVAEPEAESRRMIAFLGLDWEPGCLAFYETKRPVFTATAWEVRQPIHRHSVGRHSVGRWRHYEAHLAPLLASLGESG